MGYLLSFDGVVLMGTQYKYVNAHGWVLVDGTHCCYCQLAEYACPKHPDVKPITELSGDTFPSIFRNEDRRREQMNGGVKW